MSEKEPERRYDLSRPLSELHPNERVKAQSRLLRGSIKEGLDDPLTGSVPGDDPQLLKFHGIYQQDDRDARTRRHERKLEPAYQFMLRLRIPGGVVSARQWRHLDELARRHGNSTLRVTTRQTFQYHGVPKSHLRALLQGAREVGIDSIAACGDVNRGVMCALNPRRSKLHAEVYELAAQTSAHVAPRTGAYAEIWYGAEGETPKAVQEQEPLYGETYLPRKFKIGFVIPPENDVDVFTQDLGFIAAVQHERIEGFNVAVGGGMGRTDTREDTYPRLGDVIGFVTPEQVLDVAWQVIAVQREYGNRVDRSRARLKYTLDTHGLDWFKGELERRLGFALGAPRPFELETRGDPYGWVQGDDGLHHLTLFIENGRIANREGERQLDALRAVAEQHDCGFRLTPNQNVTITDVASEAREAIERILADHGVSLPGAASPMRLQSLACVALPTCGLAMAEAERYLPALMTRIEARAERAGIGEEPIEIRMTGCPNGCARPYAAEIGLTGRAPGKYNLYIGGDHLGRRMNRLYRENVGEAEILEELGGLFDRFAAERRAGERFGDWSHRSVLEPDVAAPAGS